MKRPKGQEKDKRDVETGEKRKQIGKGRKQRKDNAVVETKKGQFFF